MKLKLSVTFLFFILVSNVNAQVDSLFSKKIINEQVDISEYEESVLAWSMAIGGYAGVFNGEVAKVYGSSGGVVFGIGTLFNNYELSIDLGLGGAKKVGNFDFPPEVVGESNNAHWYYGLSVNKIININRSQSLRPKIGVGGYAINAGFISEENQYRLSGFDLYTELAYAFELADNIAYGPYTIRKMKHYVTLFAQMHSWFGDPQSKGMLLAGGIRFSFESFGMIKKDK